MGRRALRPKVRCGRSRRRTARTAIVSDLPGRVEIRSTKTGNIHKIALDSATLSVQMSYGLGGGAPGRCRHLAVTPVCLRASTI
jgi:hypothetical protein